MSIRVDNPIEENRTYLVPIVAWLSNADRVCVSRAGALSMDHQKPSAEGSEGSKVEWEAEQVQVYSVLRI